MSGSEAAAKMMLQLAFSAAMSQSGS